MDASLGESQTVEPTWRQPAMKPGAVPVLPEGQRPVRGSPTHQRPDADYRDFGPKKSRDRESYGQV